MSSARACAIHVSARLYATTTAGARLYAFAVVNGTTEIPGSRCISYSPVSTTVCEIGGSSPCIATISPGSTISVAIAREAATASAESVVVESIALTVTLAVESPFAAAKGVCVFSLRIEVGIKSYVDRKGLTKRSFELVGRGVWGRNGQVSPHGDDGLRV